MARTGIYLGRRLESMEAANCFVVLLVFELLSAFDALEAIVVEVRTEFFAKKYTSFFKSDYGRQRCV